MPHKHTRKGDDKAAIDLPPSEIATPLAVSKSANSNGVFSTDPNPKRSNKKSKRSKDAADDTPKAFARLMAFQRGEKLPKGLDDGVRISKNAAIKKRKLEKANEGDGDDEGVKKKKKTIPQENVKAEVPTIRPGEKMSDFNARVDAALPVSGLINKSIRVGKDPLGLKVGRTKTEKRMHRMYDEWREEEKRIQERKIDDMELAEEEEMDEDGQVKWKADIEAEKAGTTKKKGKKGGKKKMLGEVDDGHGDDPWAQLKKNRAEAKIGLNDVVQAPPTFTKVPKEKFKVKGARVEVDDVPKASGSLRKREELGSERRSVIEGYRQMMKDNKAKRKE